MDVTRIPLAPAVRWRRIRSQAIPIVAFLLAIAASAALWRQVGGTVAAIGKVDAPRVDVTSPAAGLVVDLLSETGGQWSVYDHVRAGDVLARIENAQQPDKITEIKAPISGTLIAVECWPGQMVIPGGPIATIAADYGRHIVGYIPENSRLAATPGMEVTLRAHSAGSARFTSEVEKVGQQIEQLPRHQWASTTTPEWGTPVRIKMPSELTLSPGALVDLRFHDTASR